MNSLDERVAAAFELYRQQRFDEATQACRSLLADDPEHVGALRLLGAVAFDSKDLALAAECAERELALAPDSPEALNNLGTALLEQDRPEDAAASYQRAIQVQPYYATAHYNLGNALRALRRYEEAGAAYRKAVELRPDFGWAHTSLAEICLLTGDFERGWEEYEWRPSTSAFAEPLLDAPRWTGEPLAGKTILLHVEQGIGDTLQFVRYVPLVKEQGGTVALVCQQKLAALLANCPGIDQLIVEGDLLPNVDVHSSILSLPRVFQTRLDSIPSQVPYLGADAELIDEWRGKLEGLEGYRVGINWRGGSQQKPFHLRDIPLERFRELAELRGVRVVSLQRGEGREELLASGLVGTDQPAIVDLGEDVDTEHGAFMDTAAIMKNLDLVITSDTAVAHLAGALGVPVWVALPFAADWRWLLERRDSPWYPTMRLFRQPRAGDWGSVFFQIREELMRRE